MAEHASHPMLEPESCLRTFGHLAQSACNCRFFAVVSQRCLCDLLRFRSAICVRSEGAKLEHSQVIGSALDAAVLCDLAERTERREVVGNRLGALGTLVGFFGVRHGGERQWVG